jgi:hypothetical protein
MLEYEELERMETVIDFIKEFRISNYGWDGKDVLIIIGMILAGFILANGVISFLPAATAGRVRKILLAIVSSISYGVIIFFMLNAFLTQDYGRLAGIIFLAGATYLRRGVELFYETYDKLVDKVARGWRKEN